MCDHADATQLYYGMGVGPPEMRDADAAKKPALAWCAHCGAIAVRESESLRWIEPSLLVYLKDVIKKWFCGDYWPTGPEGAKLKAIVGWKHENTSTS